MRCVGRVALVRREKLWMEMLREIAGANRSQDVTAPASGGCPPLFAQGYPNLARNLGLYPVIHALRRSIRIDTTAEPLSAANLTTPHTAFVRQDTYDGGPYAKATRPAHRRH